MTHTRNVNDLSAPDEIANSHRRDKTKIGTPRQDDGGRSYWVGQVFINQCRCWAIDLVETESTDGRQQQNVRHIYLGSEDDIVPVLRGRKPVPAHLYPRQRRLLVEIMEISSRHTGGVSRGTRTQRFSFRQGSSRGFRGHHRYRP